MIMLGGPYSGQEVKVRPLRWTRDYHPVPYLVNVWSGSKLHCYLTVEYPNAWYLVYQESF